MGPRSRWRAGGAPRRHHSAPDSRLSLPLPPQDGRTESSPHGDAGSGSISGPSLCARPRRAGPCSSPPRAQPLLACFPPSHTDTCTYSQLGPPKPYSAGVRAGPPPRAATSFLPFSRLLLPPPPPASPCLSQLPPIVGKGCPIDFEAPEQGGSGLPQ